MEGTATSRWRLMALAATLVGVAFVTFQPHWDPTTGTWRALPIHMDEYVHWGYAQSLAAEGRVNFTEPFQGTAPRAFTPTEHFHERGFQAYLATFQDLSGVAWTDLFLILPVAVALLLTLALYVLTEPFGAGVETAMWVAAIPTTLRFLGPGYVVPIAFALPFVILGIHLAFRPQTPGTLVALVLVCAALWPTHAVGAIALTIVLAVYAAARLRDEPWQAFAILLVIALPMTLATPYHAEVSADERAGMLARLPPSIDVLRGVGTALLIASALGAAAMVSHRRRDVAALGTSLGLSVSLFAAILIIRSETDIDPFGLYDRSVLMMTVLAVPLAGAGSALAIRSLAKAAARRRPWAPALAVALLVPLGALVAHETADQFGQQTYVVLTPEQHDAYVRADALLGPEHRRAVVDGMGTLAFTDITGLPTLYVRYPGDEGAPEFIEAFFDSGANDTLLLLQTGTTVVVTQRPVLNPDLVPVAEGVYALRPDYVARIRAAGVP